MPNKPDINQLQSPETIQELRGLLRLGSQKQNKLVKHPALAIWALAKLYQTPVPTPQDWQTPVTLLNHQPYLPPEPLAIDELAFDSKNNTILFSSPALSALQMRALVPGQENNSFKDPTAVDATILRIHHLCENHYTRDERTGRSLSVLAKYATNNMEMAVHIWHNLPSHIRQELAGGMTAYRDNNSKILARTVNQDTYAQEAQLRHEWATHAPPQIPTNDGAPLGLRIILISHNAIGGRPTLDPTTLTLHDNRWSTIAHSGRLVEALAGSKFNDTQKTQIAKRHIADLLNTNRFNDALALAPADALATPQRLQYLWKKTGLYGFGPHLKEAHLLTNLNSHNLAKLVLLQDSGHDIPSTSWTANILKQPITNHTHRWLGLQALSYSHPPPQNLPISDALLLDQPDKWEAVQTELQGPEWHNLVNHIPPKTIAHHPNGSNIAQIIANQCAKSGKAAKAAIWLGNIFAQRQTGQTPQK